MTEELSKKKADLTSEELEAIYAISRVATRAKDPDEGLDEIIALARPVFIFDNVVLYIREGFESLEPLFARAIGRGRTTEEDLTWGEAIATDVLRKEKVVVKREVQGDYTKNRMQLRFLIGMPLVSGEHNIGALVFVRYGGPPYAPTQIKLAEYITDHVAQLLEYQNMNTRLSTLESERRQERLQDDFVATISHELRTPLGFIKGYATTLLRDDTAWDDESRREFLTIIDEEADRLQELIDNLLDSSRLQSGTLRMDFQPVRLDTMLRDMALRARSLDESFIINLDLKSEGVIVMVDPTRMAQVFDNLVSNARKYAPDSKVLVTLTTNGSRADIAFRDYGPGIHPAHLENIFNRFYRVPHHDSSARGTGLGLYICQRIVRAHNGDIHAESEFGKGTVFHISLPREPRDGN